MIYITTRQIIKRFFEPAFQNKKEFFGSIIVWILRRLYDIRLIMIFQKITQYIWTKNSKWIYEILVWFLIALPFYHIVNYQLTKHVVKLEYSFYQSILKKYLPKFALLDNTEIEKNGTGKNISIFDSWSDAWAYSIVDISMNFVWFIAVFIYALYQIS